MFFDWLLCCYFFIELFYYTKDLHHPSPWHWSTFWFLYSLRNEEERSRKKEKEFYFSLNKDSRKKVSCCAASGCQHLISRKVVSWSAQVHWVKPVFNLLLSFIFLLSFIHCKEVAAAKNWSSFSRSFSFLFVQFLSAKLRQPASKLRVIVAKQVCRKCGRGEEEVGHLRIQQLLRFRCQTIN